MPGLAEWPVCAECTNRYRAMNPGDSRTVPVEEIGCEKAAAPFLLVGRYSVRIVVTARCSHGHGANGWESHARTEVAEPIDCPVWWNVSPSDPYGSKYLQAAIRSIVFFKPGGERPAHRMVTLVT